MIVLDASVLTEVFKDEELHFEAVRLLEAHRASVPDIVYPEVVSSLRRSARRKEMSESHFMDAVDLLIRLPVKPYPTRHLMTRAFELHHNLTPYDASYVALAESLGCPLVTTDRRLASAPGPRCEIRVLGATSATRIGG